MLQRETRNMAMKYIDAEKLKAEIRRLEGMDYPCDTLEQSAGFYDALDRIKSFIAHLVEELKHTEVWVEGRTIFEQDAKKSEVDLEEAAFEYGGFSPLHDVRIDAFKAGAKWQKKQKPEWSDEDEAMRDNILRILSYFVGTVECDSNPSLSTSYPVFRREMNWLKSLEPQPKQEWIKEQTKKQ